MSATKPTSRGWRGPGAGPSNYLAAPEEWRATSRQVCGLWPFAAGSGSPMIGVPMGRNMLTGGTLCMDPISWFMPGKLISNPSAFVLGLPGLGKALDVQTPVPTPTGFSTMGGLRPGDHVIGANGLPTVVVAVSDVMEDRPCYELEFSTGEKVVADAEHLWHTETRLDRMRRAPRNRYERATYGTTEEITAVRALALATAAGTPTAPISEIKRALGWTAARANTIYRFNSVRSTPDRRQLLLELAHHLESPRNQSRLATGPIKTTEQIAQTIKYHGHTNHSIRTIAPVDLPAAELPVPPYSFGAWLGDGTSSGSGFTSADAPILDRIRSEGLEVEKSPYGGDYLYRLSIPGQTKRSPNHLVARLRQMGVLKNKHIPAIYLRASLHQRRELLAGLLDTDGWVADTGFPFFTSTSEALATGVAELAASLGYRTRISQGVAMLDGREIGPKWDVSFATRDEVFDLERKNRLVRERQRTTGDARRGERYIVAARPVRSRPVRCIQVAADDGLFAVTPSFIVTHNSSLIRHMLLGLMGYGVTPIVLGDKKPDYVDLIEAADGQVIRVGRGRGHLNVLDQSIIEAAAERLTGRDRTELLADAHGRRLNMVASLITVARRAPISDREESIVDRALHVLRDKHEGTPVLADLLRVIQDAPEELRAVALDRGNMDRYRDVTDHLEASLIGLQSGRLGDIFAGQTTVPLKLDRPAVFDVSSIGDTDEDLLGATLLACWSYGFGAVGAAQTLADHGLEPRRHYFLPMDEFWAGLRVGRGIVDRADALTRLNRTMGVGWAMISHTTADLDSIPDAHERAKAQGFVERAGMVIMGGLPDRELAKLHDTIRLSGAERDLVSSWSSPAAWDAASGAHATPPGQGKFLVKVGGRPGIPLQVVLTKVETEENRYNLQTSNKRWQGDR